MLCAGREHCGLISDRTRIGEQIRWTLGQILGIVRVEKLLATLAEWVSPSTTETCGRREAARRQRHLLRALPPVCPGIGHLEALVASKFEGSEAVFARLDNEMSWQVGNIACLTAADGRKDPGPARATTIAAEAPAADIAFGEPNPDARCDGAGGPRQGGLLPVPTYGGPGEGPKRSVVHFASLAAPRRERQAERPARLPRARDIGWKYNSKPSKDGEDNLAPRADWASRA